MSGMRNWLEMMEGDVVMGVGEAPWRMSRRPRQRDATSWYFTAFCFSSWRFLLFVVVEDGDCGVLVMFQIIPSSSRR